MSWSNCGVDKNGRPIGYAFDATCDHPGCNKEINRGLSYACGDSHGETEYGCEKYFCTDHISNVVTNGDQYFNICGQCKKNLIDTGEWVDDEEEGCLVYKPEPEETKTYAFTFGYNHLNQDGESLGNCYVLIDGSYGVARQKLVDARGAKWSFQYESAELAGATQFNLELVSLEDVTLSGE